MTVTIDEKAGVGDDMAVGVIVGYGSVDARSEVLLEQEIVDSEMITVRTPPTIVSDLCNLLPSLIPYDCMSLCLHCEL